MWPPLSLGHHMPKPQPNKIVATWYIYIYICMYVCIYILPSLHSSCSQNSVHWKSQPQGTKVLFEPKMNKDWSTNKPTTIERSYVDIFGLHLGSWVVTYCPRCNVKRSDGEGGRLSQIPRSTTLNVVIVSSSPHGMNILTLLYPPSSHRGAMQIFVKTCTYLYLPQYLLLLPS